MEIEEFQKYKTGWYLALLDENFMTGNGKMPYFSGSYYPILITNNVRCADMTQFNLVGCNKTGLCFHSFGLEMY